MKTLITFEVLSDREIKRCDIPVEHNFSEIPGCTFLGYKFPPRSVEDQVMEYLDSMDKTDLMNEYGFDIIFDYWPTQVEDEFDSFIEYIRPYITKYPSLERPVEAIICEAYDILFGCGKTHETKAKEVFTMLSISHKSILGTFNVVEKIFKNIENESGENHIGFIGR